MNELATASGFLTFPSLDRIVCQPCTATQFQEDHYSRLSREICQEPRYHRKQWEYIYILRALEQFGLLAPDRTGLGFGCGKEPLAAVMAKNDLKVTVTDIPPLDKSDSHWGSRSAMDLFYGGICSKEKYLDQVIFRAVDMNDVPDDFGGYDFLWSCCALEHLGSLKHGLDFIMNSTKCLKAGGIAVHTTELNVSSDDQTYESPALSLYRKRDLLALQSDLFEIGCSVLPMNFYTGKNPEDKHIDLPPYEQKTHLKLLIEKFVITSFGIVLRKN
jgi:2-polyprenyl-3-methyl-5-hydroxy-6-metoxy-1,4-benzoquinol methylase